MRGKFYGVGIGPGDPDLITIKAVNVLKKCDYCLLPKSKTGEKSTAFSIAQKYIKSDCITKEVVFPMTRNKEELKINREKVADEICEILDKEFNVAFITLGDPVVYSTCMYEYQILKRRGYECEIISGVTSFCAAAARAGISLCEENESFAVVPALDNVKNIENVVSTVDNIVIMKAAKSVERIKEIMDTNTSGYEGYIVSKCTMEDEKVFNSLENKQGEELSYFTTAIVKKILF